MCQSSVAFGTLSHVFQHDTRLSKITSGPEGQFSADKGRARRRHLQWHVHGWFCWLRCILRCVPSASRQAHVARHHGGWFCWFDAPHCVPSFVGRPSLDWWEIFVFNAMLGSTVDATFAVVYGSFAALRTWQSLVRCCMLLMSARKCGFF